ncbi:MAG: SDR family NAD(P)-dependent oxidoreductase [Alphaproteobacteria bacterium]|nr:SDR family NAD(P)-dependent oxidoreductase [Alphaproteobacteria bacterium]
MQDSWRDTSVFITGVCGTIGRALVPAILDLGVREIIGIDNNETELFFHRESYAGDGRVRLYAGDVRDRDTLIERMGGVDIVIHAAAYKHVILNEEAPRNAVQINILGTSNVIDAALACAVGRVLFTSSDKAVNPTNVMGTSKLMGERLITAANANRRSPTPMLASVRFGNVLGSRGSVIPLFKKQIAAGGPLTLTDDRMSRFIMAVEEAARLVLDAVMLMRGGEVFVTKMPTVRIADLADVMVEELAPHHDHRPDRIAINRIGAKAGEKLYEELLSEEESGRTLELDRYFAVLPAFRGVYRDINYDYPGARRPDEARPYTSALERPMDRESLRRFLHRHHLLTTTET